MREVQFGFDFMQLNSTGGVVKYMTFFNDQGNEMSPIILNIGAITKSDLLFTGEG